MNRKTFAWIFGVIIALIIIGAFLPDEGNKDEGITGLLINEPELKEQSESSLFFNVTYIVDGDTIEIETKERIRLICIDAPERGEEGYLEAREYLESLILNKNVRLEKDISETDMYGRLLRYIYLENEGFVNELIVREGYAGAYPYNPDTTLCPIIQEAEDYAKVNERGIWKVEIKITEEQEESPKEESPPENQEYICDSNYYNCGSFSTFAEAQSVFEYCGGTSNDIHDLDRDSDGIACESLP